MLEELMHDPDDVLINSLSCVLFFYLTKTLNIPFILSSESGVVWTALSASGADFREISPHSLLQWYLDLNPKLK